ncbi:hypothetical protein AX17_004739 [Amanita inopinata Kibby_2008]|nr:hypothetical protein AX17_004739 [Amanita inopinata Kibby_2008]
MPTLSPQTLIIQHARKRALPTRANANRDIASSPERPPRHKGYYHKEAINAFGQRATERDRRLGKEPQKKFRYPAKKTAPLRPRVEQVQRTSMAYMTADMQLVVRDPAEARATTSLNSIGYATKSAANTRRRPFTLPRKSPSQTILFARKSAARKSKAVIASLSSPDEEEESEEESVSIHTSSPSEVEEQIDELYSSSSESERVGQARPKDKTLLPLSPPVSDIQNRLSTVTATPPANAASPSPPVDLLRALQLYTLPSVILREAKQLPFLPRTLRRGFEAQCRSLRIPTTPTTSSERDTTFLVRYEHVADAFYERQFDKWQCPLCDLFGRFATREMLKFHIKQDHQTMFVEWDTVPPQQAEATLVEDTESQWKLHILIPESAVETESLREALSPPRTPPLQHEIPIIANITDPHDLFRDDLVSPSSLSPPTSSITQSPPKPHRKRPRPLQFPHPPPSSNRLGPSVRQPYLPRKSSFGGPDLYYSTRPGGPYLFDLLGLLPLEPYGVMEWLVLEREEEIFECDEVRDELKVIQALWNRWMMLNRSEFVGDHYQGTIHFIDDFWRMIHLAAGWEALLYQLLVLASWRFLKGRDIVRLLAHYERLVGMQFWDEWDSGEE